MIWDKIHLFRAILTFILPYTLTILRQKISALIHNRTYRPLLTSELKNVVVIGGSFAGFQLVRRLTQTLPTGYRVVLIEKNSDLNYLFAFPRFSVVGGHEHFAFIPYDGIAKGAPEGIFAHVQDTAIDVTADYVFLKNREKIRYAYLVIATGTSSPRPSKVTSIDREGGMKELQEMQHGIAEATKIAIIGGGAVGVELASDIKSFYPEKNVTLIHSRGQLMPNFGKRLHEYTMRVLKELGVEMLLNERPRLPAKSDTIKLSGGTEKSFDLIIPCTGQRPNSSILAPLSSFSISKSNYRILVKPTLQIVDGALPQVFAFGDVADTGGPKMARAAYFQSEIIVQNILSLIKGEQILKEYRPNVAFEGSIKLTLGKSRYALYMREENEREILVPLNNGQVDLGVQKQWTFFGANPSSAKALPGDRSR